MAAQAATARLRRTFHYPSESASSSDEADSVMDEQGGFSAFPCPIFTTPSYHLFLNHPFPYHPPSTPTTKKK